MLIDLLIDAAMLTYFLRLFSVFRSSTFGQDDIIGSPYAVVNYTANVNEIGTDADLAAVRALLNSMGMKVPCRCLQLPLVLLLLLLSLACLIVELFLSNIDLIDWLQPVCCLVVIS